MKEAGGWREAVAGLVERWPERVERLGLGPSAALLSRRASLPPALERHPALRGWAFYVRLSLDGKESAEGPDWDLLLGQLHGFAAALSVWTGEKLAVSARLDERGHLHLPGLRAFLDLGPKAVLRPIELRVGPEGLEVPSGEARARFSRDLLLKGRASAAPGRQAPGPAASGPWRLRWEPAVTMGMEVSFCDPILTLPLRPERLAAQEHRLAELSPAGRRRFVAGLRRAMETLGQADPEFARTVSEEVRVVVPLERADPKVHVSSTYSHLRGAVYLCHDGDPLVQAETLLHEACHNRLNTVLETAPLLTGGEEASYLSPWRKDPRPLRGLLLGAHAFLHVARLYARAAARPGLPTAERTRLQERAARRCLEVASALDTLGRYGDFTSSGRGFLRGMHDDLDKTRSLLPPPEGAC